MAQIIKDEIHVIINPEGKGREAHLEIQFYDKENNFIRIWPDPVMISNEMLAPAAQYLNMSNLPMALYFPVKPEAAARYYDGGEMILIYCHHTLSNTGFWFTVKEDDHYILSNGKWSPIERNTIGTSTITSMTKNFPALDIQTNILRGITARDLMSSQPPVSVSEFHLFFFAH